MPKKKQRTPLPWLNLACNSKDKDRLFCQQPCQDFGFAWGTDGHRLHIFEGFIQDENGEDIPEGFYRKDGTAIGGVKKPGVPIKNLIPDLFLAAPAKLPDFSKCERKPIDDSLYENRNTKGDVVKIGGAWFVEQYVKDALKGLVYPNEESPKIYIINEHRDIRMFIENEKHNRSAVIMGVDYRD